MDQSILSSQIFERAFNRARTQGFHFGPGADNVIRDTADRAAREIIQRGEPALIEAAEKALERLVDEMIAASREIPGYTLAHPHAIGEETLAKAMNRLCPLWPIC